MACIVGAVWRLSVSKASERAIRVLQSGEGRNIDVCITVGPLNIEAAGHSCWLLEVYLLGT